MHNRKQFLIYPPDYKPGDGNYVVRYSKRQASKVATKMGAGACVDVQICRHPAPRKPWCFSSGRELWVFEQRAE